jgi:uncharacterized protein (UPF0332 family)
LDWFSYFDLAQEWAENENEAYKRSAVSRAYYAMFCTARDALGDDFNPPKCGSSHLYLWEKYKENAELRRIGVLGDRLKKYRVRADYYTIMVDVELSDLVEYAMIDAEELRGHLDGLIL